MDKCQKCGAGHLCGPKYSAAEELAELWEVVKAEALDEYATTLPHISMAVKAMDRIIKGGSDVR